MSKLANVWVFSDNVERYAELMTAARQWGEQVHLIVQGNEQAEQVKALGADDIIVLEHASELQRVENYAETVSALLQTHTGLLLMPASKRTKSLGARLSMQLNAAMVNDATSVTLDAGALFAEHRMYGGLAFGKEKLNSALAIITLALVCLNQQKPILRTLALSSQHLISRHFMRLFARTSRQISQQCRSQQSQTRGWRRSWPGGRERPADGTQSCRRSGCRSGLFSPYCRR